LKGEVTKIEDRFITGNSSHSRQKLT